MLGAVATLALGIPTVAGGVTDVPVSQASVAVAVRLELGDSVEFLTESGRLKALRVVLAGVSYSATFERCRPIANIRYESTQAIFQNFRADRASGSVTVTFRAGRDAEERFGELPKVQINFVDGTRTEALLETKVSSRSAHAENLCG